MNSSRLAYNEPTWLDTVAAWLLALLWILPLAYAVWTAFHASEYSTRFVLLAPLTLDNFRRAWEAAPFARYFLNTTLLVLMILACRSCWPRWPPSPSRATASAARTWPSPWCWCS
jgi:sn-glycerol 3-phosphate transport system permease protein